MTISEKKTQELGQLHFRNWKLHMSVGTSRVDEHNTHGGGPREGKHALRIFYFVNAMHKIWTHHIVH